MKCINCGKDVSMWATVCPHCYRHPGNILENLVIRSIRWFCFWGLIIIGITSFLGLDLNFKSAPQVNNKPIRTQQQLTQTETKTENSNYNDNEESERIKQQQIKQMKQMQEKSKKEAENALF